MQSLRILNNGEWNKPPVLAAARRIFSEALKLGFEAQPLGDLADFLNGTSYDQELISEIGVPVIRISNITDPGSTYIRTSQGFADRFSVRQGDLLVSWSASFKSIIWPGPDGILNQHIFKVTERSGCNRSYVKHIIEAAFDEMQKNVVGMGMMHLRRGDFLGHKVPKPPLLVQESVAKYLDWLEDSCLEKEPDLPEQLAEQRLIVTRIKSLASRIQEAKQLRRSIQADMDSLLVAMAHRNDLGDDEKRAQGWKRTVLGDVLAQVVDPVKVEPGQEYPHFGIYSFAKGLFCKPPLIGGEIKASNLYRVREEQFIYSKLKAFEGAFGVVPTEYDGFHVSNEFPTFELDRKKIDVSFLLAYTKSPQVWKSFAVHSKGVGARRERLKPENLLAETLWLPPLEWQQKIKQTGNWLASIRQTYADTQPELDALLPSILDRAFKGEL